MTGAAPRTLDRLLDPWFPGAGQQPIKGVTLDSREVEPGFLFMALAGSRAHGLDFLEQALAGGAAAVIYEPAETVDVAAAAAACRQRQVALVSLPGLGGLASAIAGRFYDDPSTRLRLIGVTGTDGKTSVSQFIAQCLDVDGRCGVIGTLGSGFPGGLTATTHTTPDPVTVQRLLAEFAEGAAASAVMEVSSHALDQGRVDGLHFNTAVLTNLGRDHLDYHGTVSAYEAAKRRLFEHPGLEAAVLNLDDDMGRRLREGLRGLRLIGYSLEAANDAAVSATEIKAEATGLTLQACVDGACDRVHVPLIGRFNAYNVLATLGALVASGLEKSRALARLSRIRPVPGRMEPFGGGEGRPTVIVDYAHTPGALEAALTALRAHVEGRIWCVFGCGGDRDPGKRPLMGQVARAGAEYLVLTNDNPRSEDAETILAQIRAGTGGGDDVRVIPDRAEAIRAACREAGPGDAVLVAGKGHEDYQIIGADRLAFSDRETVSRIVEELA
ncbi:MAG: UDP-N-acetylmuramoyl-L-alanyl-D-glutamate--2,6-diaminopimelate ligase [Ectothiorhodospiraceae bacterium]